MNLLNSRDWLFSNETINTLALAKNVCGAEVAHLPSIKWNTKVDQISLHSFIPTERTTWTKRQIFSDFVCIFDPFDSLAPVVLTWQVFNPPSIQISKFCGKTSLVGKYRRSGKQHLPLPKKLLDSRTLVKSHIHL